jgi:hypothetical protein
MKANAVSILAIFEKKLRLEVPLFQRQYVWNQERQWEPLWEDISRKFTEYMSGRKDAPVHFLGAIVLDQKQTPTTHVERRQVIDGQQRLITLQIFLATLRDFCREKGCADLANECESFIANKGMMTDPEIDKFKVWPTQLDQAQFNDVMTSGGRSEVEKKHPRRKRKYSRVYDARPRMVEAYIFFYNEISEYFLRTESEPPLANPQDLPSRLEECFQALKNALHVVVIDLDPDDDAQVIFETLNARGEPLLPADLLRNYIFLRVAREGESQENLYKEYWQGFDDPFWRQAIRQGRLIRPRSDLFMQHFLASRQAVDIPIKHLYIEYKWWIERKRPFKNIREELSTLAKQGNDFKRIIEPKKDDILYPLVTFLRSYDIGTVYPLLLYLLDIAVDEADFKRIALVIESYLLRRAVCGYTTKGYNRIFLTMIRFLQENGANLGNINKYLSGHEGESTKWPTDEDFGSAWQSQHAYQTLSNEKIVYVLRRIDETFLSNKHEIISIEGPLSVEHILPQGWIKNWLLPDSSKGMTYQELRDAQTGDVRADATNRRNSLLQTFGNLTILTQPLNSSLSNSAWDIKKPELLRSSLLPINQLLHDVSTWDEQAIENRSKKLFEKALGLWSGPIKT